MVAFVSLCIFGNAIILASPQSLNDLYHVKKIYIEDSGTSVTQTRLAWMSDLRKELTRVGFEIVDNTRFADAILNDEVQAVVVLDGPQPDPPQNIYLFKLTTRNNVVVWQTKVNVRSRLKTDEVNAEAARRFAERLLQAWLKSARRSGLKVGNKVS